MDFFIQNAYAQGGQPQGDSTSFIIMMVLMFGAFYFLLIRPQQKKQKAHKELVASLSVGNEILTAGGILGKITGVGVTSMFATLSAQSCATQRISRALR